MTWLKIPDDFAEDCDRAGLSHGAIRTHLYGLIWAMKRATGGHLDKYDLRFGLMIEPDDPYLSQLINVGFWRTEGDGWRIVHCMEHQLEPDVIERRREMSAERQRRKRRRDAGLSDDPRGDSPP